MCRRVLVPFASLLAVVLAVGLALAAPTVAAPTASGGVPAGYTRVVLQVRGCDGCPAQAASYPSASACQDIDSCGWSSTGTVRRHKLVFLVPTQSTRGLSVQLTPRWSNSGGAANVVFQYGGFGVGSRVSKQAAARASQGYACWAGTTATQVRFKVRVVKFDRSYQYGVWGWKPRAWATTTQQGFGDPAETDKGSLGAQEVWFCGA